MRENQPKTLILTGVFILSTLLHIAYAQSWNPKGSQLNGEMNYEGYCAAISMPYAETIAIGGGHNSGAGNYLVHALSDNQELTVIHLMKE